jgi:hypothetical protein
MTQNNQIEFFGTLVKPGLYSITCVPISKHYIGQSENVQRRINAHRQTLRKGLHANQELQKDFNKYGEKNFLFQKMLFGIGLNKDGREKLETQILLTLSIENRYNKYTNWRKRDVETNPFYGKRQSQEAREQLRQAAKTRISPFLGQKQTNEVKKLISQQNQGMSQKERRKAVYIDSFYYESISHASEMTGYARRIIRERCHSQEKHHENFKWAYDFDTSYIKEMNDLPPQE